MLKKIRNSIYKINKYLPFFKSFKYYLILTTFLGNTFVFASEEKEKGSDHTEVKAENNSEAGAEGESDKGGEFVKKDEYLELNASIEQMNAKLKSKNENLKKLLLDKDQIKDPNEFKGIVKNIETEYHDIKEIIENIEKKRAIIRFRFPEKSFVKKDEKTKVQAIEEIGAEAVIEKEMDNLLKLVESQFGEKIRPETQRKNGLREPANEHDKHNEFDLHQNPEDFSKVLILKK